MLSRMPWLVSRRRLLFLSIVDYIIIIASYIVLQNLKIINTNFIAINILAFCWIITCYTLDKYSIIEDEYNINFIDKCFRAFKSYIICGLLFKVIIIIFSFLNSNVGDGKWLIFIGIISSLSLFYEFTHTYFIKKYLSNPLKWISIYSNLSNGCLISKVNDIKKYGYFKSIHKSQIDKLKLLEKNHYGFIIEDINSLSDDEKKVLIVLKNKGFKLLSLINWLERYLHRYPQEIISSGNILNVLLINRKSITTKRIKRICDFSISIILLFFSFPLILLAGLLIKIEDNGPIFYSQKRSGFSGNQFTLYKLRSMKTNAEDDGIKWSSKNDKRITKIGSLLRRTRLDELPQLISVVKGDMSLIGPRPERPEIDDILAQSITNYQLRYLIRPGLSGWAQVNYPYGASIEDTKMKFSYDMYYIKNLSIIFDILIFFETIRLVFNFRGSIPK